MYSSWTENVIFWRNFLGFIWDIKNVLMMYNYCVWSQSRLTKLSIWLITFQNYPFGWLRFKIIHLVDYVSKLSNWLITFQNYPIGWLHFEIEPILNAHFSLKFSNYTSLKRFLCLKWILKLFSTILHSQFKYHTLPVTPFK